MKNSIKKSLISLGVFALVFGWTISSNVQAATPVEMYDNVWRLINSKYVDQTNNEQDWNKWRHKYDKYIQTDEDAYIAIIVSIAM